MTQDELRERLLKALHQGGWVKSSRGCLHNESGNDPVTREPYFRVVTWRECEYRDEHVAEADYLAAALGPGLVARRP